MTAEPLAAPPRGRLAPSPTGRLHLGNAFAFLLAWLHMRSVGGSLLLRMEDIDPERSRPDFADSIAKDLAWLGISWDEGPERGGPYAPYTQSARRELYASWLEDFDRRGLLYPCFCTRKELRILASAPHIGDEGAPYPGTCRALTAEARGQLRSMGRQASQRLNTEAACALPGVEGGLWEFEDMVLGRVSFSLCETGGDFALRRSDGVIAYQLAVAVDDAAMKVSHVVRGQDLLPSTPRQLLLFRLMGVHAPRYAHVPLLHDARGERLAKRHNSLELGALRKAGVKPEAITGYLGYLAGCLDRPEAAPPPALLPGFSLSALTDKKTRLPENIIEILLDL